jgi:hypothetical protein
VSSPTERGEPTLQNLAEGGRTLTAARIEIGATERAPGGERAYALTATGADMRATGCHIKTGKNMHMCAG